MGTAVLLLWASCLWSICRGILCLLWTASPWRRVLVLAVLLLAVSCARRPRRVLVLAVLLLAVSCARRPPLQVRYQQF